MTTWRRWGESAISMAERLPLWRLLPATRRRGAAQGLVLGLLVVGILSALAGAWNRGLVGLIIGAVSGGLLGGAVGTMAGLFLTPDRAAGPPRASVHIILDTQDTRYSPGAPVNGYVQLDAENTFRINGLKIYFVCRGFYEHVVTDGQGDGQTARESRQYLLQQEELVPPSLVRHTVCATYPFRFTIPADALPTHHGYLCSVHWTLHAVLEFAQGEPAKAQQEILVESMPPLLSPTRGRYQSEASQPDCQLTLTLPMVVYGEGDTVEARVHVSPLEAIPVSEVRAVLLRIENTPLGDDHVVYIDRWDAESGRFHGQRQPGGQGTTYVWLEDEAILTPPDATELHHPLIQTATLHIPSQWRPTMRTKDGQVVWKLGVVVARTDGEDLRALHEVIVHTGAAEITQMLDPQRAMIRETIADMPAE